MTGPEHYCEAEKLLRLANQGHNQGNANEDRMVAQAQVHATLALAAATALNDSGEMPLEDLHAWKDAASAEPAVDGDPE